MKIDRRDFLLATSAPLVAALVVPRGAAAAPAAREREMQPFQALFEKSLNEKKGVTLWVRGQAIPLVVTKIGDGVVEGKSRELSAIVVRIDSIDGAGIA